MYMIISAIFKKHRSCLTNIPLMGDAGNRTGYVCVQIWRIWGISASASQFHCQSKTALKKKSSKKWKKERECWGQACVILRTNKEGFLEVTCYRKQRGCGSELKDCVGEECSGREQSKYKDSEIGQCLVSSRTTKEVSVTKQNE